MQVAGFMFAPAVRVAAACVHDRLRFSDPQICSKSLPSHAAQHPVSCQNRESFGERSRSRAAALQETLRLARRQWEHGTRSATFQTSRGRPRRRQSLVLVLLAPGVNLRLDDNAALTDGIIRAARYGSQFGVVVPAETLEKHALIIHDLDEQLRKRGSYLGVIDSQRLAHLRATLGTSCTIVIQACIGAEACIKALSCCTVFWSATTKPGKEPISAPEWLPPAQLSLEALRLPSRASATPVAADPDFRERAVLRALREAAPQMQLNALEQRFQQALNLGVLSRARLRFEWGKHQHPSEPHRLPMLLLGVALSGSLFNPRPRRCYALTVYDIHGNHKRELRWDAKRHRFVFRERDGDLDYEAEFWSFARRKWLWLKQSFIPEDVTADYYEFAKWRLFQRLMSSTVGVFGTQALLIALGIKSGNKISQAATISWVLKDGLSRVGKMLWASQLGRDMDADPKRFRFFSALLYSLGNGLEIATRIVPQSFLLVATLANTAKLCSMLTASATRNAMYRSFADRNENIADITAKGEAQITIADLGGMALGIQLSKIIGTSRPKVVATYLILSAVDLFAIWKELRVIEFRTLNLQRTSLVIEHYLKTGLVPNPKQVSAEERVILPEPLPRHAFVPFSRLVQDEHDAEQLIGRFGAAKFLLRFGDVHRPWTWLRRSRAGIVLHRDAGQRDIFRAILCWNLLRLGLVENEDDLLSKSELMMEHLLTAVREAGWQTFVYPKFKHRAFW
ncbi:hypothetical protein CCYA_CCYA02G0483 [Cyanidiococcus yangmingshanensis]|nr:hypothetical protein CCYA_CCYA02G0483 [Cyanidiococcus yangmingshanensis]